MLSGINWSTAYWQARQIWTLVMADAERMGRNVNQALDSFQPQWDSAAYAPRTVPVYARNTRPSRPRRR